MNGNQGGSNNTPTINLASVVQTLQNSVQALNAINQTLNKLLPNGAYIPFSQSDAAASTNSLYYSTTTSKLTYKDPSGSTHELY
jgi:hypothetical protein